MKKEKDYTLTIDVHVTKEETTSAKRWYSIKIYGHPIQENLEPLVFEVSNMREEQTMKVGKKLLDAIWNLVETRDGEFWKS